ncbi:MAG: hypothetical protein DHS20C02_07390 [Micavibrio sp.]|nr:MAG: hypothetical protein DHS20C02_07390 [Micavibrio sp.]
MPIYLRVNYPDTEATRKQRQEKLQEWQSKGAIIRDDGCYSGFYMEVTDVEHARRVVTAQSNLCADYFVFEAESHDVEVRKHKRCLDKGTVGNVIPFSSLNAESKERQIMLLKASNRGFVTHAVFRDERPEAFYLNSRSAFAVFSPSGEQLFPVSQDEFTKEYSTVSMALTAVEDKASLRVGLD